MAASGAQVAMALLPVLLGLSWLCAAESMTVAEEAKLTAGNEGEGTWCMAKPSSSYQTLQNNIEYSCGQAGVNCRSIQAGGSCYYPRNVMSHASFSMNLFYKAAGNHAWDCHFNGTGLIVANNPSIGNCNYPA